jgi:hypothetical protein
MFNIHEKYKNYIQAMFWILNWGCILPGLELRYIYLPRDHEKWYGMMDELRRRWMVWSDLSGVSLDARCVGGAMVMEVSYCVCMVDISGKLSWT